MLFFFAMFTVTMMVFVLLMVPRFLRMMACCTSRGRGNIFPARARPGTGMCTARARKLKAQDVLSSLELSDEERVLVLRRIR